MFYVIAYVMNTAQLLHCKLLYCHSATLCCISTISCEMWDTLNNRFIRKILFSWPCIQCSAYNIELDQSWFSCPGYTWMWFQNGNITFSNNDVLIILQLRGRTLQA